MKKDYSASSANLMELIENSMVGLRYENLSLYGFDMDFENLRVVPIKLKEGSNVYTVPESKKNRILIYNKHTILFLFDTIGVHLSIKNGTGADNNYNYLSLVLSDYIIMDDGGVMDKNSSSVFNFNDPMISSGFKSWFDRLITFLEIFEDVRIMRDDMKRKADESAELALKSKLATTLDIEVKQCPK